jgi:hypothetical protein
LVLALKHRAVFADTKGMDEAGIDEAIAWGDYDLAFTHARAMPAKAQLAFSRQIARCLCQDGEAAHGIELRATLATLGLARWEAKRLAVDVGGARVVHALTDAQHPLPLAQMCDLQKACVDQPGQAAPTSGLMLAPRGAWAEGALIGLQRCRACEELTAGADAMLDAELQERVFWPLEGRFAQELEAAVAMQVQGLEGENLDGHALWQQQSQKVLGTLVEAKTDELFAAIFPAEPQRSALAARLPIGWSGALVDFVWHEMMHPHWWYEHTCLLDSGRLRLVEVRYIQRLCWIEAARHCGMRADGLVVASIDPASKILSGALLPFAQRQAQTRL